MGVHANGLRAALAVALLLPCVGAVSAQDVPPLPTDLPVWMIGSPRIDGTRLRPFSKVRFAIGGAAKDGPLTLGAKVQAQAYQELSLRADRVDGRDVWVRSFETFRADDEMTLVANGSIVMDRRTLAPLSAVLTAQGSTKEFEYDWDAHVVRLTVDGDKSAAPESLDLVSVEAGAHETWVAAIDWGMDTRAMIPSVLAGGGGKWWAVPHVVGTEEVDIGDGVARDAWVVELDWWGMGADHTEYTPGGGVNGTAGSGGKYWVIKNPLAGAPLVVRIQTEANPTVDQVHQLQDGIGR